VRVGVLVGVGVGVDVDVLVGVAVHIVAVAVSMTAVRVEKYPAIGLVQAMDARKSTNATARTAFFELMYPPWDSINNWGCVLMIAVYFKKQNPPVCCYIIISFIFPVKETRVNFSLPSFIGHLRRWDQFVSGFPENPYL
jgi:hypothetical protein